MKTIVVGAALGTALVGYKVAVYATAAYKLKKEKQQKIVNLGTISEYKAKLEKEKEK